MTSKRRLVFSSKTIFFFTLFVCGNKADSFSGTKGKSFLLNGMKILMVCLGNICRSPLAQGILEKKLSDQNLQATVDSAATSDYHVGDKPDPRSIHKAAEYGIDITHQRGRQIQKSDFQTFDRIFAMDTSNYNNIISLTNQQEEKDKVELILNLSYPTANMSVPDPYYGGEDGFENVYRLLDAACDVIIKQLKNE